MAGEVLALASSEAQTLDYDNQRHEQELFESLNGVTAPETGEPTRNRVYTAVLESRIGRRFTTMAVVGGLVGGATELALAPAALASSPAGTVEVTPPKITSVDVKESLRSGSFQVDSVEAGTKVTFLSYVKAEGMGKKQIRKEKREGDCKRYGKGSDNPTYWNTGRAATGGMVKFKDTAPALACPDENGKMRMVEKNGKKHDCFNLIEKIGKKLRLPQIKGKIIQVKSLAKKSIKLDAVAEAGADAGCKLVLPNGEVSASGHGRGRAEAHEKMSLKAFAKTKGKSWLRINLNLKDKVKASAAASASANCEGKFTADTPPPSKEVPSKDGKQGAGTNTPGNTSTGSTVGGPGAGGSPDTTPGADPNTSVACRDADGDISVTDQFGNCIETTPPAAAAQV